MKRLIAAVSLTAMSIALTAGPAAAVVLHRVPHPKFH